MHEFCFTVVAAVERVSGKFTPRADLEDQLYDAIYSADPGSLDGDDGAEYEVVDWTVELLETKKRSASRKEKEVLSDADLLDLEIAMRACLSAFPIVLSSDGRDPYSNLTPEQMMFVRAFQKLVMSPGISEAITQAKVRRAKAKARAKHPAGKKR